MSIIFFYQIDLFYFSIYVYLFRPSSSRHGSRRSSPSRGGRTSPAAATLRRGGLSAAEIEARKVQTSAWPHRLSFMFAAMSALLGMFSMSRFAILTIDFGGKGRRKKKLAISPNTSTKAFPSAPHPPTLPFREFFSKNICL